MACSNVSCAVIKECCRACSGMGSLQRQLECLHTSLHVLRVHVWNITSIWHHPFRRAFHRLRIKLFTTSNKIT